MEIKITVIKITQVDFTTSCLLGQITCFNSSLTSFINLNIVYLPPGWARIELASEALEAPILTIELPAFFCPLSDSN